MSSSTAAKIICARNANLFSKRQLGVLSPSRSFASSNSSDPPSVSGPSVSLKSWESGAKLVKNVSVENQYLEHIREVHDPSLHLKTIEDELKGTIGKALGKQGDKVLSALRLMHQERMRYEDLIADSKQKTCNKIKKSIKESAIKHNEYRSKCIQARWELTVHRQAVGFIVNNHNFVREKFPIGDALPIQDDLDANKNDGSQEHSENNTTTKKKKQFTDQLDWWHRIGRWK